MCAQLCGGSSLTRIMPAARERVLTTAAHEHPPRPPAIAGDVAVARSLSL
jgi:hypothetical protein